MRVKYVNGDDIAAYDEVGDPIHENAELASRLHQPTRRGALRSA